LRCVHSHAGAHWVCPQVGNQGNTIAQS
jgi:hypothetical protein